MIRNKNGEVIIASLLKSGEATANRDKDLFSKWECGSITTSMCLEKFLSYNGLKDANIPYISNINFESWLWSLGYRRHCAN